MRSDGEQIRSRECVDGGERICTSAQSIPLDLCCKNRRGRNPLHHLQKRRMRRSRAREKSPLKQNRMQCERDIDNARKRDQEAGWQGWIWHMQRWISSSSPATAVHQWIEIFAPTHPPQRPLVHSLVCQLVCIDRCAVQSIRREVRESKNRPNFWLRLCGGG